MAGRGRCRVGYRDVFQVKHADAASILPSGVANDAGGCRRRVDTQTASKVRQAAHAISGWAQISRRFRYQHGSSARSAATRGIHAGASAGDGLRVDLSLLPLAPRFRGDYRFSRWQNSFSTGIASVMCAYLALISR